MRLHLADVNLWIATIVDAHPHRTAARRWWAEELLPSGDGVAFCRLTQLSLLRLLTNEKVMGAQRLTVPEAWRSYRRIAAQRQVAYLDEPPTLEAALDELCRGRRSSRNFWTDAYLAAFAISGSYGLVTFDRGFRKFTDLDLVLLS